LELGAGDVAVESPASGVDAMINVAFLAPFNMPTTLRFLRAVVGLEGMRVGLVSQESAERLPADLRRRLAAHYRVERGLDVEQLSIGVAAVAERLGSVDRLLAVLEQLQVPAAAVRERLSIAGMGVETARNFRDKSRMKTRLREFGLPCARHQLVTSAAAARLFAADVGFPIVAKPPAGAGALSTFRVDRATELDEALRIAAPAAEQPLLLEEFMTGDEHSFDSVMVAGRLVWYSVSRYLATPLEVLQKPWLQWSVLLPRELDLPGYDEIREVASRALEVLGLDTGLSHMEWFRRPDGSVAISEVGARPPGAQITTLLSYAHDIDLYRAWAGLMVDARFDAPPREYAVGAVYLRGRGAGRVVAVHGLERAQAEVGELVVEAHLPQPGQTAAGGYEGDGYVVVRHPETRVVSAALERINDFVRVEVA